MNKYYQFQKNKDDIEKLHGPIFVLGAGGFIGINILQTLLFYRKDVFGVTRNKNNWRLRETKTPSKNIIKCDLSNIRDLKNLFLKIKPKTIFNLASYGAYAKQQNFEKIYEVNFITSIRCIEIAKKIGFTSYIYAGSNSEYGLHCGGPHEIDSLLPNSHYAVSKAASSFAHLYYGRIENLPIVHLRLYSVYGPWEEPDRLIPTLISKARKKVYPNLVHPEISRDFIYVTDVTSAAIYFASHMKKEFYGEIFNIGTGKKTTIKQIACMVKNVCHLPTSPKFGKMKNRDWDLQNWYANIDKITKETSWRPQITLKKGLKNVLDWQRESDYDQKIMRSYEIYKNNLSNLSN